MATALRQLLLPERLASAPVYMAGLLSAPMLGWAVGGVIAGVLSDYAGALSNTRTMLRNFDCF